VLAPSLDPGGDMEPGSTFSTKNSATHPESEISKEVRKNWGIWGGEGKSADAAAGCYGDAVANEKRRSACPPR